MNNACRTFVLLLLPFTLLVASGQALKDKSSQIDALFQDYSRPGVPGASVMVIRGGKVLYQKAYGLADLEEKTPATTKTNYRLASVTKQFTAMAVMILAERKKLSYDSRLTDFFPDFPPYGKQITVRHLLNHTSGLLAYEELIPEGTKVPLKDKDVLRLLKQQDHTYFPPGSKYRYSNSGYALLALIVEAASGTSFAEFLKQNIFDPLRMTGTVAYEQGISTVRNRAYGYTQREKAFERTDQSLTSSVLGDGGIYSSVEDLYQWDQALYTAKLVSPETLKQAFTPGVLSDGQSTDYGFGWSINSHRGLKTISHAGSTVGFRTAIERFPDQRFTVIVLINRNSANPSEIARQIADLFLSDPQ